MNETIIISLGGSLIVPDEIDAEFLKEFKALVLSHVAKGKKFIIITGGGGVNRVYNQAAKELTSITEEDLDWIGIAALNLNAELVRVMFKEQAEPHVLRNLEEAFTMQKPILIGSAYQPGRSTDWDAVVAAKTVGAKKIINLSNIDFVYDSDPKKNPAAKKFEAISWAEYRKIIPTEWVSKLSSPFDPIASEMAEKEKMEVVIMNGKPIENLAKCLNGEKFQGTIIS